MPIFSGVSNLRFWGYDMFVFQPLKTENIFGQGKIITKQELNISLPSEYSAGVDDGRRVCISAIIPSPFF